MSNSVKVSSGSHWFLKLAFMFVAGFVTAVIANDFELNFEQITSCTVFTLIILATLLFWDYHLAIAFVGIGLLMILNVLDLPRLLKESKIDVILFLVVMMIIVGVLKELGLFSWMIITVISIRRLTATMFVTIICIMGALMACMVDEVTAIVLIAALIFQVCDTLNIKPLPFMMMTVMAINVGSAGTMLGNPVGIFIGQNAAPPLSFIDFMKWSFPLMAMEFVAVYILMLFLFRRDIREMNVKLQERRDMGLALGPIVKVPHGQGLFVLVVLMSLLSLHSVIERWLGLLPNTMLIMTPMIMAGLLLIWRREHVRKYLEHDVEWNTLLFFMMLFAVAGTLEHTKVTAVMAEGFVSRFGGHPSLLAPIILGISFLGSAFVENIVFVAAFVPVVNRLEEMSLMWALLHGACLGGNITMIGSTANIAAVGMMEKRYNIRVIFFAWLKTGIMVGVVSFLVAWAGIVLLLPYMPTQAERLQAVRVPALVHPTPGDQAP